MHSKSREIAPAGSSIKNVACGLTDTECKTVRLHYCTARSYETAIWHLLWAAQITMHDYTMLTLFRHR